MQEILTHYEAEYCYKVIQRSRHRLKKVYMKQASCSWNCLEEYQYIIRILHSITLTVSLCASKVSKLCFNFLKVFRSYLHLYQTQLEIFIIMYTTVQKYMNYNVCLYNHWMSRQLLIDIIGNTESRCGQKLCLQIKKDMPLIDSLTVSE